MADTPPPPPGFTLDAPPPPPGFKLDAQPKSIAPPPPPPGFKVDQPVPQKNSGIMSQLGNAALAIPRAQGAGLSALGSEYNKEFRENEQAGVGDITAPIQSHDKAGKPGAPLAMDYAARVGKTGMDALNEIWDLTGAHAVSKTLLGRPIEEMGGPKAETVANATDIALPFAGDFKALGTLGKDAALTLGRKLAPKVEKAASDIPKPSVSPPAAEGPTSPPPGFKLDPTKPPEGTPLSKPAALTEPRAFEDQLNQLEQNRVADKVDALKTIKDVPEGVDWEKLYHHEEDPEGVPLTPEEKTVYDKHIAPIREESNKLSSELEDWEARPTDEKHTPRYVAGRTRSFGEVLNQWKKGIEPRFGGASGRSMRKTVDAQKSRRMYNAVDPETGAKTVVHVGTSGKVLGFDGSGTPKEFGQFPKGQAVDAGSKVKAGGKTWILEQATTKEIEEAAKISYNKNLLANRLDNLAKLRAAVRNKNFIEGMKNSPDWEKVAVERSKTATPPTTNGREWRTPKAPQFSQYYMEPQIADALDDYVGHTHDLDGLENGLDKAGNVIKGSIFWNPIPHMRNIANLYFTGKGLVGTATSLPSSMKALANGFKSVITQDARYMKAMRSGASLPYARYITRDLNKALTAKLGGDMVKNPGEWAKIAQAFGYANPANMIKAIYTTSNKALWGFGDTLTMARLAEEEGKGVSSAAAIPKVEKDMPSYRIPGQVMGSRVVSRVLQSPLATMFGRYQYHRIAMLGRMAKDLVDKNLPLAERAQALDKMAMLAVQMTLYYPIMDKVWQTVTGNKNAKVMRPGATTVPQAAYDVATGARGPAQAASSVFSPGAMMEAPLEIYHGRYAWDGEPIAYPENLTDGHPDQFARDIGSYVASKVQPIGQGQRILEGAETLPQFILSQIGVTAPTDQAAAAKQHFQARDAKFAVRRAGKLAAKRAQP